MLKFGENFESINTTENRLSVLKPENKNFPEFINFPRKIREELKESTDKNGWPEIPKNINNLTDLFNISKNQIINTLEQLPVNSLNNKIKEWIENIPEELEYLELKNNLSNQKELLQNLKLQQFSNLEPLRKILPEAWKTLIMLSSEIQNASLTIINHWKYEIKDEQFKDLGLSKPEFDLFLKMSSVLGKYFDHGYLKQIELADLPSGSLETKHSEKQGAEHFYDITDSKGDIKIKTYREMFPFEWNKIIDLLEKLSEKVEYLLNTNQISSQYKNLPEYLKQMSLVFKSPEINPQTLHTLWKDLYQKSTELLQSGCPIMLIPQGNPSVAGAAEKVDIEIRLGIRTKETKKLDEDIKPFREIALDIKKQEPLANQYGQIINIIHNIQPIAYGPNLYWKTEGESDENSLLSHINVTSEKVKNYQIPLISKLFKINFDTNSEQQYLNSAIIETDLHEIGHSMIDSENEEIQKRIGRNQNADILEELKAELVTMKILNEAKKQKKISEMEIKNQILAKLGTIINYLKNNSENGSGQKYFYAGIYIINKLLEEGLIIYKNNSYVIKNNSLIIEILSKEADKIMNNFYLDKHSNPNQVKNFITDIKKYKENKDIQNFIDQINK